jgi:hypothetical protein
MASKMSPKRTVNVRGQKHSLAYINDQEKRMLRKAGGSGKPGPSGVPTYFLSEGMGVDSGGSSLGDEGYGDDGYGGGGFNDGIEDQQPTAAEMAKAQSSTKTVSTPLPGRNPARAPDDRTRAQRELDNQMDRANRYGQDENNSFINRLHSKASVKSFGRIKEKLNEKGSVPIRNKSGKVVGVMHDNFLGLKVYSGQSMSSDQYAGPAEFKDQVVLDFGDTTGSDSGDVRSGAKKKKLPVEIVDGKLPDAPKAGEGGDATDDAARRSKMGKESTISTTAQGLLGSAKTRNRSLMAGLIS